MDLNVVLGAGLALIVAFYILKALSRPLAGLGKIALRSAVTFAVIWGINIIGQYFGFHMGMNLVSALAVGALGIPGAALLLAVKYLI